jgi:hypothetical protein
VGTATVTFHQSPHEPIDDVVVPWDGQEPDADCGLLWVRGPAGELSLFSAGSVRAVELRKGAEAPSPGG